MRKTDDLLEWVGRRVVVFVDRPLASIHPEGGLTYDLNYGYVPGTLAADGEPVDAYVVGVDTPVEIVVGVVVGAVVRHDDVEDKLVVATGRTDEWTLDAIRASVAFQERFFDTTVFVDRSPAARQAVERFVDRGRGSSHNS